MAKQWADALHYDPFASLLPCRRRLPILLPIIVIIVVSACCRFRLHCSITPQSLLILTSPLFYLRRCAHSNGVIKYMMQPDGHAAVSSQNPPLHRLAGTRRVHCGCEKPLHRGIPACCRTTTRCALALYQTVPPSIVVPIPPPLLLLKVLFFCRSSGFPALDALPHTEAYPYSSWAIFLATVSSALRSLGGGG